MFSLLVEDPAEDKSDPVTGHPAEGPGDKYLYIAVFSEEFTVGHRTGNEKRDVALDGAESEDGVDAVLLDDLGKMIHKITWTASLQRLPKE
jgi:hypothetical protein